MTACTMGAGSYAGLRNEALDYARNQGFANHIKLRIAIVWKTIHSEVYALNRRDYMRLSLVFVVSLIGAAAICLLCPNTAYANFIDDILGMASDAWKTVVNGIMSVINGTICEPLCDSIIKSMLGEIKSLVKTTDLLANFDSLLSSKSGNFSASGLITSVSNAAVKPVAATLLAMGMLLQLLKIARKMDQGGGMMPSVREVFALFVWCAIMMYMVRHGIDIVKDFYSLILNVIKKASSVAGGYGDPSKTLGEWASKDKLIQFGDNSTIVDGLLAVITCLLAWLVANFAVVISEVMVLARAIEIYVMAMFAPIPFSLFGFDETRSWGWGYIKNFLALCLAGVVMVIVLYLFPYLVVSMAGDIGKGFPVANALGVLLKMVVCCITLCITLSQATDLARKAIGG